MSNAQAEELMERDSDDVDDMGQHTQDAFQNADYFINVVDNVEEIKNCVFRLIDLLFGNPFITPTFDEYAMFLAYAASLRSADLSRQIGAVITKNNEILTSGVNDSKRKDKDGHRINWDRSNASIRNPMRAMTYLDYEKISFVSFYEETEGDTDNE